MARTILSFRRLVRVKPAAAVAEGDRDAARELAHVDGVARCDARAADRSPRVEEDWASDDLPYMMNTAAGPLCAMPLTYEWSDRLLLVHHNLSYLTRAC